MFTFVTFNLDIQGPIGACRSAMAISFGCFMVFHLSPACTDPGIAFSSDLGENFSQSEYVAISAISRFAFPPLTRVLPSCVTSCKSVKHICSKEVFYSINLLNVSFFTASQTVKIYISLSEACHQAVSLVIRASKPTPPPWPDRVKP